MSNLESSTARPLLIVLRGPSGSGKSSTAEALRAAFQQDEPSNTLAYGASHPVRDAKGTARVTVVGQDVVRRQLLKEPDVEGGVNIALVEQIARFSLERGIVTIVEGIFNAGRYGAMLRGLRDANPGPTLAYYLDVSFEETLRRHATKPNAAEFGEAEMRRWYRPLELVPGLGETVIREESTAAETLAQILGDLERITRRSPGPATKAVDGRVGRRPPTR